jgi:hypothetical protein
MSFSGTTYPPFFGNNDVVHCVDPMCAVTGIIPQPYVTDDAVTCSCALSSSGTVTKWYGDGPRQNHTSPLNSRFTRPA